MSIHTGEKPYHCNQCQKSFARAHILKQNLRTFSGEKPYYCNECKKYFTQNSNLKSHMRTHTGEKLAFLVQNYLEKHQLPNMNCYTGMKTLLHVTNVQNLSEKVEH